MSKLERNPHKSSGNDGTGSKTNAENDGETSVSAPDYLPESVLSAEAWRKTGNTDDLFSYEGAYESNVTPMLVPAECGSTVVRFGNVVDDSGNVYPVVKKQLSRFDTPVFAVDTDVVMLLNGSFEFDLDGTFKTGEMEFEVESGWDTFVVAPQDPAEVIVSGDELLSVDDPVVQQFGETIGFNTPDWSDVRNWINSNGDYAKGVNWGATLLLEEFDIIVTEQGEGDVLLYDPDTGVYEDREAMVREFLSEKLGEQSLKQRRNEIISEVSVRTAISDMETLDAGDYDETLVCVQNGVIDFDAVVNDEGEVLRDHSPDYKFTLALNVEYDPDVDSTVVSDFLAEITQREADALALEELAVMTMIPDNRFEAFGMLYGPGANGKTTFANMIRDVLGMENVSSKSLQSLATTDNNFPYYSVYDKLANICAELPEKKIKNTKPIKELSSNDVIDVEPKGRDSFSAMNSATQIYMMNDPPVIDSKKEALSRRIVPINLPYKFTPVEGDGNKQADPQLGDKLASESAKSELLLLAIAAYERLDETGDVSLPETYEERLEMYNRASDTIYSFAKFSLTGDRGSRLPKDVIYTAYTNYCRDKRTTSVANNSFFRKLSQNTDVPVDKSRPSINGERVYCLKNIGFTDDALQFVPEAMRDEYDLGDISDDTDSEPADESNSNQVALNDLDGALRAPDEYLEVEVLGDVETSGNGPALKLNVECTDSGYRTHVVSWQPVDLDVDVGGTYRLFYVSDSGESVVITPSMTRVEGVGEPDEREQSRFDDDDDDDDGDESDVDTPDSGESQETEWSDMSAKESVYRVVCELSDDDPVAESDVLDEWVSRSNRERETGENALSVLVRDGDVYSPLANGEYLPMVERSPEQEGDAQ